MRTSSCLSNRVAFGLVVLAGLCVTAVHADPMTAVLPDPMTKIPVDAVSTGVPGAMEEHTGYVRVASSTIKGRASAEFRQVATHPEALGATVYFMVFDHKTGTVTSGTTDESGRTTTVAGDAFGTKFEGFDKTLVAGLNSDRPNLDTRARYLYLYQIVNDSGLKASVKDITIRLLVPTRRITSWGHFVDRSKNDKTGLIERRGLGFSISVPAKVGADAKNLVQPVSTDFQGVQSSDEGYSSPGEAKLAPQVYGITRINVLAKGGIVPAAAAILPGDDPGREPESVVLVPNADFSKTRGLADGKAPAISLRLAKFDSAADPEAGTSLRWRTNWPALRVSWRETPIAPKQRSVIFGFTSHDGPTRSDAALTPRPAINRPAVGAIPAEIVQAMAEISERIGGVLPVDSEGNLVVPAVAGNRLPVPVVREVADGPPGGGDPAPNPNVPQAPGGGGLGGLGGGLGGLAGTGGGVGGSSLPGVPAGQLAGRSGGGGGGLSGGGTTGTGTNGTTGTGTTQGTTTGTGTTQSVIVNQNQNQNQNQKQKQKNVNVNVNINKNTNGNTPPGNVVPAPPAWLLGILGLPVFMFISRRRKKAEAALANSIA